MTIRTTIDGQKVEITDELLTRYDRPLPRYTSYPTAPIWTNNFTPSDHLDAMRGVPRPPEAANDLSIYVHIPFCKDRCRFCGCGTIATDKKDIAEGYLLTLKKEIMLVSQHLKGRRAVQVHLGGGSPNYLTCGQLERLWGDISSNFNLAANAEVGIEIDPRRTTARQLNTLGGLGFNRLSVGVQDLSEAVQTAIGRIEPYGHVEEVVAAARSCGFGSINCDLIYGLPFQTRASFEETLNRVARLGFDRVACFNFAYLPEAMPHQRTLPVEAMPGPKEKLTIFCRAIEFLGSAGYDFIGMDHFAKANDEMALAAKNGTLWRNFQGYTTRSGTDLIGIGTTAISDGGGCYSQNAKDISGYDRMISSGSLATVRGWRLSPEDITRRRTIREIFCGGETAIGSLAENTVMELQDDGLISVNRGSLKVTPLGRLFIRNIASLFDAYLDKGAKMYSRAI